MLIVVYLYQVVNTLALFLTPNERACSKYANGFGDLSYERDLFLQGLVQVSISRYIFSSAPPVLHYAVIPVKAKCNMHGNRLLTHVEKLLHFLLKNFNWTVQLISCSWNSHWNIGIFQLRIV